MIRRRRKKKKDRNRNRTKTAAPTPSAEPTTLLPSTDRPVDSNRLVIALGGVVRLDRVIDHDEDGREKIARLYGVVQEIEARNTKHPGGVVHVWCLDTGGHRTWLADKVSVAPGAKGRLNTYQNLYMANEPLMTPRKRGIRRSPV